ncbi:MAG: ABC transporter substrate-binding protein [Desulfobacteraceae bacterium]|nr:ABC transporter substrate-binding protein [Desulfobacteraceae bacterium]
MRKWVVAGVLVLSALFIVSGFTPCMAAQKLIKFNTAWEPEHETFITWWAKEKGWDKEVGLDFNILYFDSGMGMMEALPAKQWTIGALGGTPAVVGAARYGSKIIAIGNDESVANVVLVRPDSPIMKVKGFNPKYPEVYGSPETIKGKTVVTTTVSSAHFVLSTWLGVFGLKDSDVVIKNMDPFQCVAAFEAGIGDIVTLWAPHMYTGIQKGWKIAGDIKTSGKGLPIVIVGEKEFLEKEPEQVKKFMQVYFRGIDWLKATPIDKLVPDYKRFMKDFCGLDMNEAMCKMDLEKHPIFTAAEQIKMMDGSKGPSVVETWELGVLEFFTAQKKLKEEDAKKVVTPDGRLNFITDQYLKMIVK